MRFPNFAPGRQVWILAVLVATAACTQGGAPGEDGEGGEGSAGQAATAFAGARIVDGTGAPPIEEGVLVVRSGRIRAVGPMGEVEVPDGARVVDLSGRTVIPGVVNAHGHVGTAQGLESGPDVYTRENILDQLGRNARYGVTTVLSLGGGGPEGVRVRDEQSTPGLDRARLFLAGPVLDPGSPEEATAAVADVAGMEVDWVKIRVDDFLGRGERMTPAVYGAVIEEAHARDLPVAAHIVYLEDAKGVVRAGADLVAHSVRDEPVDRELIRLMTEREVCVSPTLVRELSTYVYGERPDFFDDPFFLREADSAVVERLLEPEVQARYRGESARYWREHLPLARENLQALHAGGVGVAFGTDTGPPARFQGYFEHVEMELMAEAGLEPAEILRSATGEAARCVGLDEDLGTLEPGHWADFVVLRRNPLDDIRNVRTIEEVRVAGNVVPGSRWSPSETGESGW